MENLDPVYCHGFFVLHGVNLADNPREVDRKWTLFVIIRVQYLFKAGERQELEDILNLKSYIIFGRLHIELAKFYVGLIS